MKINNFDPNGNNDDFKSSRINSGIGMKSIISVQLKHNASDK
jgi:hypothetical protein